MTPALLNLKRRLAQWELEHLRQHAAELAERLEAAEERASAAEQACDFWHDQAIDAHNAAAEAAGGMPGITIDGRLVIVPAPTAGGLHA